MQETEVEDKMLCDGLEQYPGGPKPPRTGSLLPLLLSAHDLGVVLLGLIVGIMWLFLRLAPVLAPGDG